jgi:hypothetical protein
LTKKSRKIDPVEAERMSERMRSRLEKWASEQPDRPSLDEAVRRVIQQIPKVIIRRD